LRTVVTNFSAYLDTYLKTASKGSILAEQSQTDNRWRVHCTKCKHTYTFNQGVDGTELDHGLQEFVKNHVLEHKKTAKAMYNNSNACTWSFTYTSSYPTVIGGSDIAKPFYAKPKTKIEKDMEIEELKDELERKKAKNRKKEKKEEKKKEESTLIPIPQPTGRKFR
jgi:hypothetical protein